MVDECNIYRTTRPKDRENAVNLDHVTTHVDDQDDANNNRSRQTSESSDTASNSEFEDSKSALSADSDSEHVILISDPSQTVQENNVDENVSRNLDSGHEQEVSEERLINSNGVDKCELSMSHQNMQSSEAKCSLHTEAQHPIPKARGSLISSSQPISTSDSFYNQLKRALSLSPQNTSEHYSTSKSIKLTGTECLA